MLKNTNNRIKYLTVDKNNAYLSPSLPLSLLSLSHLRFSVWLDTDDIISGSDWHGALGTALDSCKAVIPVITQKYISSHFCKGELYMANSERKLIFPIFLEDVDLSANELTRGVKFIISGVNWTMFRSGVEDYNNSLEKLIQGMNEKGEVVEFDKSIGIENIQTNRSRRVWSVAMNYVYCAINFR